MLCTIELGTVVEHRQSKAHYWVVSDTLMEACAKAIKQAHEDYGDDVAIDWTILEAEIKSVDDPVS